MSRLVSAGVDPDLHCTGVALLYEDRSVEAFVVRIEQRARGEVAVARMSAAILSTFALRDLPSRLSGLPVAVEAPGHWRYGTAKAQDVIRLSAIAGAASAALASARVELVPPIRWKGARKKVVHHKHVCMKMGWEWQERAGYCVPVGPDLEGPEAGWKHALDGVGLALYAAGDKA